MLAPVRLSVWHWAACRQPISEKREKLDGRAKPKVGCGFPPLRPDQHAEATILKDVEGIFIGLVATQISNWGIIDIHLREHSSHCVSLVRVCHAHLDTTIELVEPQACAIGNRQPSQQKLATDLTYLIIGKATPVHRQTSWFMLSTFVKLQAFDPFVSGRERLERVLIYGVHLLRAIGAQPF